jgi:hypothetical protein
VATIFTAKLAPSEKPWLYKMISLQSGKSTINHQPTINQPSTNHQPTINQASKASNKYIFSMSGAVKVITPLCLLVHWKKYNMYHQHVPPTCTTTNMYNNQHVPQPTYVQHTHLIMA